MTPGADHAAPSARAQADAASLPGLARAQQHASSWTAALLPSAAIAGLCFDTLVPLALTGPAVLALLVHRLRDFGSRHNTLPNAVTALRVMLTGLLALHAHQPWCTPRVAALGVLVIFVLDGLDGQLARSLNASSAQGAQFDMSLVMGSTALGRGLGALGTAILLGSFGRSFWWAFLRRLS